VSIHIKSTVSSHPRRNLAANFFNIHFTLSSSPGFAPVSKFFSKMSSLKDITYSQDGSVAAVRDYYRFLVKIYLDSECVHEPPEGGWPDITTENLKNLNKTDAVVSLLRNLPYISASGGVEVEGPLGIQFADWRDFAHYMATKSEYHDGKIVRIETEDPQLWNEVPPHVFGLSHGGRDSPRFMLDTKLGIVHWDTLFSCPEQIRLSNTKIKDSVYDFTPENEWEWRGEFYWGIPDFFELLKDQFRQLNFIPKNSHEVVDVWTDYSTDEQGPNAFPFPLRAVYKEHRWPDLELYRKQECLEAVQRMLDDKFPDFA
jgi:hypothetical protein